MSVSKKSQKKVKRPNVNWYVELKKLAIPQFEAEFYAMWKRLGFGSKSRAAYYVLKKHYSTTALLNVRWLGSSLEEAKVYELL